MATTTIVKRIFHIRGIISKGFLVRKGQKMRPEHKEKVLWLMALAREADQEMNPQVQQMIRSLARQYSWIKAMHLERFLMRKKARKKALNIPFASLTEQSTEKDFLIGWVIG